MNNKKYDPEEKFEIDLDKAYSVSYLHYHGVKTRYLEDTNTLIFSRDDDGYSDYEDLDTIIYRNYNVNEIKDYIDFNFKKMLYDELEPIYSGYPTEEEYRVNLVNNIKNTKLENMKSVCSKLEYALSPYDLIRLANEYKKGNKNFNDKVEYLLTDLNFHSECSMLSLNESDELIRESKNDIRKILEHYVLDKFITEYKFNKDSRGYLKVDSKELEDVSEYDCKYLQYEGYIEYCNNGYCLTDNYINELNKGEKKYKYVHWLKIYINNKEPQCLKNLKEYYDTHECNIKFFYYNNSFTSKLVKLECNQKYEDLELDVNSMSNGSLIKLKSKPKNITAYRNDIDFLNKYSKEEGMVI